MNARLAPPLSPPRPRRRRSGFTLLELLVVLVVLGLLTSFVGPKYFKQLGKSETKAARAQIEGLAKAIEMFRLDMGRYPDQSEGLAILMARPANLPKWNGPYLQKAVPLDPWGRPFIYRFPGQHGDYDLSTLGKDGAPGGDEENTDIGNWQ